PFSRSINGIARVLGASLRMGGLCWNGRLLYPHWGMLTKGYRTRQLAFERGRRYPSDMMDAEWGEIRSLLPKPAKRGRSPQVELREILNAIRSMARSGGGWRMQPVYWCFRRFVRRLLFQTIHDVALMLDCERAGREASPMA